MRVKFFLYAKLKLKYFFSPRRHLSAGSRLTEFTEKFEIWGFYHRVTEDTEV